MLLRGVWHIIFCPGSQAEGWATCFSIPTWAGLALSSVS
jgi:hypothetical protein